MTDITMCPGNECDKKHACYRFMASPSKWQSFADYRPHENGQCDNFIPFNPEPVHKSSFDYEAEYRAKINE